MVGRLARGAWDCGIYTQKIEKVLELRRGDLPVVILHEHSLVDALEGSGC